MKKKLAVVLSLALALGLLAGCGSSQQQSTGELNLYTWENLFPQEVLDGFTKETGIKVNYSSFDSNETMLAKLETTKGGDYDLVMADDYIIEPAIAEGLVMPLDKSKLTNLGNVNPVYQGHYYDPEDAYTVPYCAGVATIIYDPARVDFEIKGFNDLLNPALKDSIGMVNAPRVMNGMSLIADGKSVNCEEIEAIEHAGQRLVDMAPNIRFIKDDDPQNDLLAGEISVGLMYTNQVTHACMENPDLKVVYPEEGVGFGIMAQFIPANAPHPDAAHQFLNYLLRPEVAKQYSELVGYYNINKAADELIAEEYKSFLTLPAELKIGEMEVMHNVSPEAVEAHERMWTEFRTACGK